MRVLRIGVSILRHIVHRAVAITRERGVRGLVASARNALPHYVYRLTLVLPYTLYLRSEESPYALALLRSYLRVYQLFCSFEFYLEDPVSLTHVDPSDITGDSPNRPPIFWGSIRGGTWDLRASAFDDRPVPRAIRLHYEEGVPWEDTPLRPYFAEAVESGGSWGYDSADSFHQRVEDIESLVESMETDGYKTRREQSAAERTEPLPLALDEVTVDIGRDGEYMYRNLGQHRIAVAKLLDLDEIPVRIGTRHPEYVRRMNGTPETPGG